MKEVIDKASKRFIRVDVAEPVTITTKEYFGLTASFTSYLVRIETNHWAFSLHESEVRRRYSEFCWLRSKLISHHPNKVVPPLPPKRYFHMTKFDPKLIEQRSQGLEKFLQRLMRSFVFLSDAAFHLFLQSELTISEIRAKLNAEIQPNYLKRLHYSSMSSTGDHNHKPEYNRSCSSGSAQSCVTTSSENDESDRTSTSSSIEDNAEDIQTQGAYRKFGKALFQTIQVDLSRLSDGYGSD